MDQIDSMRCFTRIVESGSFSAAARALGMTQPSASKAVRRLEERLGVQLLRRTTRSLRLTEEGASYYASCVRILAELEEAEGALATGRIEPRGTLRLTCARDYGQIFVAPIALRFLDRHPEVEIDLVLDDRRVDITAEGIDLAIRLGPLDDSSLHARPLGRFRRITAAAPDYLNRHGIPTTPEDLSDHSCIVQTTLSWGGRWTYHARRSGKTVVAHVSGRLRAGSNLVVRDTAIAGFGVTLAPEWLLGPEIAAGRLAPLLPDYEAPALEVHALYPGGPFLPRKVRAFLEFMQSAWPDAMQTGATVATPP